MEAEIFKPVKQTTPIESLNDKHIIGVEFTSGTRQQVLKVNKSSYICAGFEHNCDYSSKIEGKNIADLFSDIISVRKIYIFGTIEELKDWMI